ncbi:MAG: Ig-like domain-containing protein, partial [Gemmatimonadota bacterium]|nr:Ig-like domain-containing protein [Gemmatimonadota bacterium]
MRGLTTRRPFPLVAAASALIAILAVCASPGIPPGGPVDTAAPQLVDIAPDSGATATTPTAAIFRFDEVVSERPSGAASLSALFLISPREGTPDVDWNREEVSVRPSRGWRRNTAYTITMLPGMSDLRGNVRNSGVVLVFSTGSEIPQSRIAGTVFNWLTGTPAPRAFVEVRPVADTTIAYVAATDTAGRFLVSNVAPGRYSVRAYIDDNSNRGLDPREAWDSVTVALTDTARVEMLVFPHDSVGARLANVGLRDSVTLELLFDHAIDVNQQFDQSSISIRRADSVDIPVISVTKPQLPADATGGFTLRPSRAVPSTSLV